MEIVMAFKDILGNSHVKKTLVKSLQKNRVPNSLLFCGPEGVGKKEMALVLAKALNCQRKSDDACELCPPCKAITAGNFPDVLIISPVNDVLKIEQMRTLKEIAYFKPMVGTRRVFILEEADKLGNEASNSLLKVLEEPPFFSHIILLSNNVYMILPTIKSRCQIITFSPISRDEIEDVLISRGYEREKAKIISTFVRGNLKKALELDWEEIQAKRKEAWNFFLSLIRKKEISSFLKNFISSKDHAKRSFEKVIEILSSFFRDLIMCKEGGDSRMLLNPDYESKIQEIKNQLNLERAMDFLDEMDFALYALQKNLNVNLLITAVISDSLEGRHV